MMAPDCIIYVRNHESSRLDIPMCEQGSTEERPVVIGNDVWIGGRVIILPGIKSEMVQLLVQALLSRKMYQNMML